MIRCVVFDFDGTLVLSNEIKRDGFFAIAKGFPGGIDAMSVLLKESPGDRFAIFRNFATLFDADAGALTARYTVWCEERIASCPERVGASAVLETLRQRAVKIYANSATPEEALRAVIKRRYAADLFDGVMGGYGSKVENLKAILATESLNPGEMMMIGDGTDDRDAAHVNAGMKGSHVAV